MYFLHLWRLHCGSRLAVLEINDLIDFLRLEFYSFLAFLAHHPLVTAILSFSLQVFAWIFSLSS